jgi:hypothetical protein
VPEKILYLPARSRSGEGRAETFDCRLDLYRIEKLLGLPLYLEPRLLIPSVPNVKCAFIAIL